MKQIIWKELRENFKWAVLWMLGMGLAMAYVLSQQSPYSWQAGESICSGEFQVVTTLGCALGGALLGLIQVVMEIRRDQWAFLVHRPVTRSTIFAGKVIAGLTLYLPAAGIPLLIAAWWASTPGNIPAPFDWRMILPGLADILSGVVFYFAGMLTGLRQARWYGSRAMGIAAAILCAMVINNMWEFWYVLVPIVLFGSVLALSAWGSFLTAGAYSSQPKKARFTLGLSLLIGIAVTGVIGSILAVSIIVERVPRARTLYEIDKDGTILRVTSDYPTIENVTDLNGNQIDKYKEDKYRDYQTFRQDMLFEMSIRSEGVSWWAPYRSSSRFFVRLNRRGDPSWFYAYSQKRILGYSRRSKRVVGSMGPDGYSSSLGPISQQFEGRLLRDSWSQERVLPFSRVVYEIDWASKQIKQIFTARDDEVIRRAGYLTGGYYRDGDAKKFIAVATQDQIHFLSDEAEPLFTTDYVYDTSNYPNVSLLMTPKGDRFFAWYKPPWRLSLAELAKISQYVVEYSSDGTELNRHELPPIPYAISPPHWYETAPSIVLPVAAAAILAVHSQLSPWLGEFGIYHFFDYLSSQGINKVTYFTFTLLSGLVCAVVTIFICRRYAFEKRRLYGWTILIFFLGPVGLLTFIALLDWPAQEPCHSCGKKRIVTRDHCPHCNAAFPSPAQDGTEIFEKN